VTTVTTGVGVCSTGGGPTTGSGAGTGKGTLS